MPRGLPRRHNVGLSDDDSRRTRATASEVVDLDFESFEDLDFESLVISKRKWEDLEFDCLGNIFGRVGLESLLVDVPFVCRSWYKASLDFSCWQRIDSIPPLDSSDHRCFIPGRPQFIHRFINEFKIKRFSVGGITRLLVARGVGKSACIALSRKCSDDDLKIVSEKCPELKAVCLQLDSASNKANLIEKWKQLEEIRIQWTQKTAIFEELVAQIALNCKNFSSLRVYGGNFSKEHALATAKHLPSVKNLTIRYCYVEQGNVEIVLHHCKELECLYVTSCVYHINDWEKHKLQQLASHVKFGAINLLC